MKIRYDVMITAQHIMKNRVTLFTNQTYVFLTSRASPLGHSVGRERRDPLGDSGMVRARRDQGQGG